MTKHGNDLRIVLIGAGSVSFGLKTLGDLLTFGEEKLRGSTIILHDISEDALKRTGGVFKKAMNEISESGEPVPFKLETSTDPKIALQDAHYVITSIEHGNRMLTWSQDYYVPRKYGSKQIYGENGGPGGAFHTWRQVPPLVTICHQMEQYCPDAWLLNYSNPVPRLTWALSKASKIKNIGLCHGIQSGTVALSGILGVTISDIDFISAGLNHFYWFIKANAKKNLKLPARGIHPEISVKVGDDLLPHVRARGISWAHESELPFVEECLQLYGYLTYPGQSHPGEYVPWADAYCPYVKYDFIGYARKGEEERVRLERTLKGQESNYWWVTGSGERAVQIIIGMEHDTKQHESALNVVNHGYITNLPDGCVVEVPGTVDKNGIHPQNVGDLPQGIAQLCQHEVAVQSLVVDAALTGNKQTAIQALALDGTVPSPAAARSIFSEMLELQRDLLPQFK